MATNKQILNAIRFVDRGMSDDNNHYHSIHRSIIQISGENQVIKSDITEISTYVRNGNGNNK
tara:strand:- start:2173 stop:2358 length:186 start_codon:yes stop_codon:yes gene_type:complete